METGRRRGARTLVRVASRYPGGRRLMAVTGRELTEASDRGLALARAREAGSPTPTGAATSVRGATPRAIASGRSGYARYDRIASNADIAGWLLWRNFRVSNALDVGCATGLSGRGAARAGHRRRGM